MALLAATAVLTSIPYLAAIAQGVACKGEALNAESLIPAGTDPHTFKLTPAQRARVEQAPLFLSIGAHFESWGDKLRTPKGASWFNLADLLPLEAQSEASIAAHTGHGHGAEERDPHIWHSPKLSAAAVDALSAKLGTRFPAQASSFADCAKSFKASLAADAEKARAILSSVPAGSRVLATTHDAFGYFAREFDLKALSLVGLSTSAQSTPKALASLVEKLKREKVRAVFLENALDGRAMEGVAREAGIQVGGSLFADGLGPAGSGADSVGGLWMANARTIAAALAKAPGK